MCKEVTCKKPGFLEFYCHGLPTAILLHHCIFLSSVPENGPEQKCLQQGDGSSVLASKRDKSHPSSPVERLIADLLVVSPAEATECKNKKVGQAKLLLR